MTFYHPYLHIQVRSLISLLNFTKVESPSVVSWVWLLSLNMPQASAVFSLLRLFHRVSTHSPPSSLADLGIGSLFWWLSTQLL